MIATGTSDFIIQNVVGCGPFQVIITILIYFIGNSCTAFTLMFMSFGNYNPGWRCLDFNQSLSYNSTLASGFFTDTNKTVLVSSVQNNNSYQIGEKLEDLYLNRDGNCPIFDSCQNVEFSPDSSTIVSEWGLVCSQQWIPSIIISIQMAGMVVGCPFAGHLSDALGRKKVLYAALFAMTVLNVVSVFSTSWQMFAVLRFFLGITCGFVLTIYYVFTAEFVTAKWRCVLSAFPAWNFSQIAFSFACMYLKNWRHIHIVTAIIGFVGSVPVIWVPESLRWLEVNNKKGKFERVARKIAKINGASLPSLDSMENVKSEEQDTDKNTKTYNISHLFRKAYRIQTITISVPWFTTNLIFYALGFGIKALHGSFYLNLIISAVIDIPFALVPILLPNYVGRRIAGIILAAGTGVCLLGAACFKQLSSGKTQGLGVLVLVFGGKLLTTAYWCVLMVYTLEIYPTVVRGIGTSWGNSMARISGIVAPFFIPNDPSSMYISYTVMGILGLICCGAMITLPETKGKQLQERFAKENDDSTETDI